MDETSSQMSPNDVIDPFDETQTTTSKTTSQRQDSKDMSIFDTEFSQSSNVFVSEKCNNNTTNCDNRSLLTPSYVIKTERSSLNTTTGNDDVVSDSFSFPLTSTKYYPPDESQSEWRYSTLCEYLRERDDSNIHMESNTHKHRSPSWKRKLQTNCYAFLEKPSGIKCFIYHMIVFTLVLVCLTFSVLSTVEGRENSDVQVQVLIIMEIVVVSFFGIEYLVRLWSAGCVSKYKGLRGRIRFARKPICLIDLFVVVASAIVLLVGRNGNVFATSAIRGIRFLQILRMLHMDRQAGTWRLLGSVVYMHRQELITTLYIGFLALIFSSYFVYLAEKPSNVEVNITISNTTKSNGTDSDFHSFADALWWGVITVTTIGYGDFVPKTWLGKLIASGFSIFAISFFALPAGILGSGFALKVQLKQRQKQMNRQIPAAARVIQAGWRCYCVHKNINSTATWKIYKLPKRMNQVDGEMMKNHKNNTAGTNATATMKEGTSERRKTRQNSMNSWKEVIDEVTRASKLISRSKYKYPASYVNVVRCTRILIFQLRKRQFQASRKPYDVNDVITQFTHGHINMTVRIKEMQRRLDQTLGKPGTFYEGGNATKLITTGERLRSLEAKVDGIDLKLDEILTQILLLKRENVEP